MIVDPELLKVLHGIQRELFDIFWVLLLMLIFKDMGGGKLGGGK